MNIIRHYFRKYFIEKNLKRVNQLLIKGYGKQQCTTEQIQKIFESECIDFKYFDYACYVFLSDKEFNEFQTQAKFKDIDSIMKNLNLRTYQKEEGHFRDNWERLTPTGHG